MERVKFDGDVAVYTEELDGAFVGAIQASKPLTAEQPYYELEVIDGGTQSWIGVGVADSAYPLDKQPGWDQFSVGYHADDGSWYKAPIVDEMSKSGKPQAMPLTGKTFACQKGDRIGVGLEFDDRGKEPSMKPRRVYFAKNGQYLGSIFLEKQFHGSLYPTVGFNSPGAKAKINLKADSATVQLQHSAQSFGTNEYAIDIVKDMLKKGADVNKQDAAGRTALHLASAYGAAPIATLLLEQGCDPDVQDSMGLTAMHMAAGYVRPSTTKILLESGADPELRTARNERALDLIRNLRNATKPSSMGGLVTDKRYPLMTEIMELLQSVAEDPDEWVVPAPLKPDPDQEEALRKAADNARRLVEEMKKDPEKMKELEEAMKLMQDPEFQKKVKQYASDPDGLKKLMEEYKLPSK